MQSSDFFFPMNQVEYQSLYPIVNYVGTEIPVFTRKATRETQPETDEPHILEYAGTNFSFARHLWKAFPTVVDAFVSQFGKYGKKENFHLFIVKGNLVYHTDQHRIAAINTLLQNSAAVTTFIDMDKNETFSYTQRIGETMGFKSNALHKVDNPGGRRVLMSMSVEEPFEEMRRYLFGE